MTKPFPQWQQLLAGANSNAGTSARGNQEGENSSNVYMMSSHIEIEDYGEKKTSKAKSFLEATELLHIEWSPIEYIPSIPKGSAKCLTISPNAMAAQNFSIVEDLAQSPCAMSTLEVL